MEKFAICDKRNGRELVTVQVGESASSKKAYAILFGMLTIIMCMKSKNDLNKVCWHLPSSFKERITKAMGWIDGDGSSHDTLFGISLEWSEVA